MIHLAKNGRYEFDLKSRVNEALSTNEQFVHIKEFLQL